MNFILKVIAMALIVQVAKNLFPTFWGGFFTFLALLLLQALVSVKTDEIEVDKE